MLRVTGLCVRGFYRGPMNSPQKWPVTRKMFPFADFIMQLRYFLPRAHIQLHFYTNNSLSLRYSPDIQTKLAVLYIRVESLTHAFDASQLNDGIDMGFQIMRSTKWWYSMCRDFIRRSFWPSWKTLSILLRIMWLKKPTLIALSLECH